MSNSNKPDKVLRVALRRIQKGWTKAAWSKKNKQTGVTEVCIEGAIYGYKDANNKNPACKMASDLVMEVLKEKYGDKYVCIPGFNDSSDTTQEKVEEVVKMALIRAETGGLLRETEEECWDPLIK